MQSVSFSLSPSHLSQLSQLSHVFQASHLSPCPTLSRGTVCLKKAETNQFAMSHVGHCLGHLEALSFCGLLGICPMGHFLGTVPWDSWRSFLFSQATSNGRFAQASTLGDVTNGQPLLP